MSWNHRVTKRIHNHKYLHEPEILYEIREVFYDENGDIVGIADTPDIIAHSIEDLKWTLQKMNECCDKPVVDYDTNEEIKA